ncbi:MAG: DNA polymerase III [Treponema sp.]|nr:DNA polymerase III [Treponema sp.]
MFDNVLHQSVTKLLIHDISQNSLPGAVLFSGPQGSGKFSCALEIARILSCTGEKRGHWLCECPSCMQNKALVSQNVLIAGPKDCTPEILAASDTFLNAVYNNAKYLMAARFLFIRSIRKLTMRFNPVLWQGDDKLSKIAAIISDIDEELEPIDFPHELPEPEKIEKACKKLCELTQKLESSFMYDSIPIAHIRNASAWAHLKSSDGKKTIIIENADRMLESVRNALLKILEEPPADTVFVLTTSRRNAVMPTILSRVRTYSFTERTTEQQQEVINRVFHKETFNGSIDDFLLTYLPVSPDVLKANSGKFFASIASGHIPEIPGLIKACGNFDPRIMLKIFLNGMNVYGRKCMSSPAGAQAAYELTKVQKDCWNNVTVYNQSVNSALEILVRDIAKINKIHGNILKWTVM